MVVSPEGGPGVRAAAELGALIARAPAGAVIILRPGVYRAPLSLAGSADITLRGEPGAVLDGGIDFPSAPVLSTGAPEVMGGEGWVPVYPQHDRPGQLDLTNCRRVTIEGLTFRRAWPNGLRLAESQDITVRGCRFEGGTNAIFMRGPSTRGVLIEHNHWVQDPTGALWDSLDWAHVHHGEHNHYNGAFVQGRDVGGEVHILNNTVRDAFNGIRMRVSPHHFDPATCQVNHDVVISENRFIRVADNVIEPERFLRRWSVTRNVFVGYHAPFSLDGVQGEGLAIRENRLFATERPRTRLREPPSDGSRHNRGRLFKVSAGPGQASSPLTGLDIRDNYFRRRYRDPGEPPTPVSDGTLPGVDWRVAGRFIPALSRRERRRQGQS